MDPAPGGQAAMAHGAIGRRSLTGAQPLGQRGGMVAHALLQTGPAGLLDHGAQRRPGRRGPVTLLAQPRPVLEL